MKALLIPDVDQTLLRTNLVGHLIWQILCKHFGGTYPFETPDEFIYAANGPERIFHNFLERFGINATWDDINEVAALHSEALHADHAAWFDGAFEMLQELDQDPDIELGFATNNIATAFRRWFQEHGFGHIPLHDGMESHRRHRKPNPDMILDHLKRHPEITVVVVLGDSDSDLQAAKNARDHTSVEIHAAWAEYGSSLEPHHVEGLHNPDLHMRTSQDLLDLPRRIRDLLAKKR